MTYGKFMKGLQATITVAGGDENAEKKVPMDISCLCQTGNLLPLAKYMVYFNEKIAEAVALKPFRELVGDEFAAAQGRQSSTCTIKTNVLKQICPHIAAFASVVASFDDLGKMIGVKDDDNTTIFFSKMIKKFGNLIVQFLSQCNDELGQATGLLDELFGKIQASHRVATMFEAEKLDKSMISALVFDRDCMQLMFVGGKIATTFGADLNAILDAVSALPDTLVQSSLKSMLTALQSDVSKFLSAPSGKFPKDGEKFVLDNFKYFQGSMTLAQCLTRDLKPGETRVGLTKRCVELFESKGIKCEANLVKQAEALRAGK